MPLRNINLEHPQQMQPSFTPSQQRHKAGRGRQTQIHTVPTRNTLFWHFTSHFPKCSYVSSSNTQTLNQSRKHLWSVNFKPLVIQTLHTSQLPRQRKHRLHRDRNRSPSALKAKKLSQNSFRQSIIFRKPSPLPGTFLLLSDFPEGADGK